MRIMSSTVALKCQDIHEKSFKMVKIYTKFGQNIHKLDRFFLSIYIYQFDASKQKIYLKYVTEKL